MDRTARRELDRALDEFGAGVRYFDRIGTAIYQVAPSWKTVVVCIGHHEPPYIGLIPSIPQVPALRWTCGVCHRVIFLEPPAEVLEIGRQGLH